MNAGEKAALIFGDLDVDGDGTVDEEEFIKWRLSSEILNVSFNEFICRGCLKDNDFVMLLNSGGIDPDEEEDD